MWASVKTSTEDAFVDCYLLYYSPHYFMFLIQADSMSLKQDVQTVTDENERSHTKLDLIPLIIEN